MNKKFKRKKLRTKKAISDNKAALIAILVLFISVGFSALTTDLVIEGVATAKACPAGTYSTLLSNECKSCPTGYTSSKNTFSQSKCYIKTTAGKYIATANSSTQTNCPAGSYCPSTTIYYGSTGNKSTCPSGYTSAAGAGANTKCYVSVSAGKYKTTATGSTQASCSAGTYKAAHNSYYNSSDSCTTCPAGYYCPAGASSATKCPTGYTSAAGAKTNTNCYLSVSAGKYKTTATGTIQASCPPGTYKAAHNSYYNSSDVCTTCPANTYCLSGASSPTKCASGYESTPGSGSCKKSTYTYTKTGSNGWKATYTCTSGKATMTSCSYSGTYGSATCNGGGSALSVTYMCTLDSTYGGGYLYFGCNTSLSKTYVAGGGLSSTETCS